MGRKRACVLVLAAAVAFVPRPAAADGYTSVNAVRADRGLRSLVADGTLAAIAQAHAQRMRDAGSLFHNAGLFDEMTASGKNWRVAGENVGVSTSLKGVEDGFMQSPGHYSNIVDPSYTALGVGIVTDSSGRVFVTQVFAAFRSAPAAPAPTAPAPAAPPAQVAIQAPTFTPVARVPSVAPPAQVAVQALTSTPVARVPSVAEQATAPAQPAGTVRLEDGSVVSSAYFDAPVCSDDGWIGTAAVSTRPITSLDEDTGC